MGAPEKAVEPTSAESCADALLELPTLLLTFEILISLGLVQQEFFWVVHKVTVNNRMR